MGDIIVNGQKVSRVSVLNRGCQQMNGRFIPDETMYIRSGTLGPVQGGATGSITIQFDAYGLKLKRFEVFHSGSSREFDVVLDTRQFNSGSNFDPRELIVEYFGLKGSVDFSQGIDQLEDIPALTDASGSIYLRVMPHGGPGDNTYKWMLFFEGFSVYVNEDNTFA